MEFEFFTRLHGIDYELLELRICHIIRIFNICECVYVCVLMTKL